MVGTNHQNSCVLAHGHFARCNPGIVLVQAVGRGYGRKTRVDNETMTETVGNSTTQAFENLGRSAAGGDGEFRRKAFAGLHGELAWASSCSVVIFSRACLAARAASTFFFKSGARAS